MTSKNDHLFFKRYQYAHIFTFFKNVILIGDGADWGGALWVFSLCNEFSCLKFLFFVAIIL